MIHDLLLVELFDIKYYNDLEMWVRGHSRSLKIVPFKSLGIVSYWSKFPSHSSDGCIISHFQDIQCQRMAWSWNLGLGSFKVIQNSAVRL